MPEGKISFKGHELDYSGHVIGAFPSVDVIHQQTEDAIRRMNKNVNERIIEYCLKINIDPDVLLKQKAEIEMLLMKNDLLMEENKKAKEIIRKCMEAMEAHDCEYTDAYNEAEAFLQEQEQ